MEHEIPPFGAGQCGADHVDPISLIDMEIDVTRTLQENREKIDRTQALNAELVEKAEALFAPHVYDPVREKTKMEEVLGFVLQDCGAGSPDQLVDLMQKIDKVTRQEYPDYGLLDRVWILAQRTRARKAQEALRRGP